MRYIMQNQKITITYYQNKKNGRYYFKTYQGQNSHRKSISPPEPITTQARAAFFAEETAAYLNADIAEDTYLSTLKQITRSTLHTKTKLKPTQIWETYQQITPKDTKENQRKKHETQQLIKWLYATHPTLQTTEKITPEIAYDYSLLLIQTSNTGKTAKNKIDRLKTIFNKILPKTGLTENPFNYSATPDTTDSRNGRPFHPHEIPKLLQQCKNAGNQWYEISILAWLSMLRLIDLCNLEKTQIRGNSLISKPSKTQRHKIKTLCYIPDSILQIIQPLLQANPDSPYIFPTRQQYYGIHRPPSDTYSTFIKKAGINKETDQDLISFHSWRHTGNTTRAENNIEQITRMIEGGWTDINTEGIYNSSIRKIKESGQKMGEEIDKVTSQIQ